MAGHRSTSWLCPRPSFPTTSLWQAPHCGPKPCHLSCVSLLMPLLPRQPRSPSQSSSSPGAPPSPHCVDSGPHRFHGQEEIPGPPQGLLARLGIPSSQGTPRPPKARWVWKPFPQGRRLHLGSAHQDLRALSSAATFDRIQCFAFFLLPLCYQLLSLGELHNQHSKIHIPHISYVLEYKAAHASRHWPPGQPHVARQTAQCSGDRMTTSHQTFASRAGDPIQAPVAGRVTALCDG